MFTRRFDIWFGSQMVFIFDIRNVGIQVIGCFSDSTNNIDGNDGVEQFYRVYEAIYLYLLFVGCKINCVLYM